MSDNEKEPQHRPGGPRASLPNRYTHPGSEEFNNGEAVALPVGYIHPTPLEHLIATMVREAVQSEAGDQFDSPEDADDFEPDQDNGLLDTSPYTIEEVQEEVFAAEPPASPPQTPSEAAPEPAGEPKPSTGTLPPSEGS